MLKDWLRRILPPSMILLSHKIRGMAAAIYYNYPGRKLIVIGITGTKGKTTTAVLIAKIIEAAGYKVGLLSTVSFKIGRQEWPNETNMGTLPPFRLQAMLRQMVEAGCQYAVVETTSHSLVQRRVYGVDYRVAVFTNLTHDHLDYHGNFDQYKSAKGMMFANRPRLSVINTDDKAAPYFWQFPADHKVSYGLDKRAQVMAQKIVYDQTVGTEFTLISPTGEIQIKSSLPGRFNIYNILAAVATTLGLGIGLPTIKSAIESVKLIPGRMEKVEAGQSFTIIVDYAHTPDSFEKIYETLRPATKGKIIHVFGSTGDRDKTKRPIMGAIAGRNADVVIVTDDEPYTEDPAKIVAEIAKGVPRGASKRHPMLENENFWLIVDRRQAIAKALSMAGPGDVVIVTGMGALTYRTVGHQHIPWKDQDVIKEELEKRQRI